MGWDPFTGPVNYFVLEGLDSPGIATIRDGKTKNVINTRKPSGSSGAVVVSSGQDLITFTATLELFDEADFELWDQMRTVVDRLPGGKKPKALAIEHPILADLGITAVLVEGRSQLTQTDDNTWTVDIYFKQYRKPKPVRATPAGSRKKKNQEEDELDKEIRRLTSQRDGLADA